MENILVEQMVIGTLLNNNDLFELVSDILEYNFFSDAHHQIFFREIKEKLHKGSIANIITLSSGLSKHNISTEYLAQVSKYVTTADNIREYAKIIREFYIKREAVLLGDFIKEKAKDEDFLDVGIYKIEERLYSLSTQNSDTRTTLSFSDGLKHVTNSMKLMLQTDKRIVGLTTGFIDLDAILGGLHGGHLYVLAARPSMGKSALASNMAVNCALSHKYGGPAAFISLEMPYNQIITRIMSSLTNVPLSSLINCHISKKDFNGCLETLKEFQNLPLYIYDSPSMSIGEIRTTLRQMKRKYGVKVAFIDYLQLAHSPSLSRNDNRVAEVSRITRELKSIAMELNVAIVALSQLSRAAEAHSNKAGEEADTMDVKKPELRHLRESGSIEQDADVVMFIMRQDYYSSKKDNGEEYLPPDNGIGLAKLYVDKNRNGATGVVKLMYSGPTTTFKNAL